MRLFRRVGSRSTDASDTPSGEDPQLTGLRLHTQTASISETVENLNRKAKVIKSNSVEDNNHIKHLQQVFAPQNNLTLSPFVARSVTNSPKISGMPKSITGGKLHCKFFDNITKNAWSRCTLCTLIEHCSTTMCVPPFIGNFLVVNKKL